MLGRHSPQGELFRPDNVHLQHVGRDSLYGLSAEQRHRLFRDEDYEAAAPQSRFRELRSSSLPARDSEPLGGAAGELSG